MPSVLKPRTEMKNYQVDQIKELIELKGAKCSIPIAEMSADDYYKMFDYLINLGEKPESLRTSLLLIQKMISNEKTRRLKRFFQDFHQMTRAFYTDTGLF